MLEWIPLSEPHHLPEACGLYLIRHRASGKEYVGKSVNVRSRAYDHRRASTGVTYLYRAIRKHGVEAFDICVLALGDEAAMTALEIEAIAARATFNPAGYNQTRGGDGVSGYRATAEHRAAIVARQTGRPVTEEAKAKMRAARLAHNSFKGRKHTPETIERIRQAAILQGAKPRTETFRAAIAASNARKKGTTHSAETRALISQKLKGKPKPEGFRGGARPGDLNPMYGKKGKDSHRAKSVLAWQPGSFTPVVFDSNDEAATWAGCSPTSMSAYCKGKQKAKTGILFAYT